ncbi:MAG: hypothetical protein QXN71_03775 [Candidatus Aenigmatarchaeota archaeon]
MDKNLPPLCKNFYFQEQFDNDELYVLDDPALEKLAYSYNFLVGREGLCSRNGNICNRVFHNGKISIAHPFQMIGCKHYIP